jgi:hypothetical protein
MMEDSGDDLAPAPERRRRRRESRGVTEFSASFRVPVVADFALAENGDPELRHRHQNQVIPIPKSLLIREVLLKYRPPLVVRPHTIPST